MLNYVEFEVAANQNIDLETYTGIFVFKDGDKCCYNNGLLHCEDGPAWTFPNGSKSWWINGRLVYKYTHDCDWVCIEDGLPCNMEWLGQTITQKKVLTVEGIKYLPNLPGM